MTGHYVMRFLASAFSAALAALFALAVTAPIYVMVASWSSSFSLGEMLLGTVALLPFVVIFGLPVALPVALLAGAALVVLELRLGHSLHCKIWAGLGFAVGCGVSLFFGTAEPVWPVRVISAIWFGGGAAIAAILFRGIMARR